MNWKLVGILTCVSFVFGCDRSAEKGTDAGWIEASKLTPGEIRHEALSEDLISRITILQQTFAEVDPTPLDKWIEDFRRDQNPDREIVIWEGMAETYYRFVSSNDLNLAMKNEAFGLLLMRSGAPTEEVLERASLKFLSREQAVGLLKIVKAPPKPIRVIQD